MISKYLSFLRKTYKNGFKKSLKKESIFNKIILCLNSFPYFYYTIIRRDIENTKKNKTHEYIKKKHNIKNIEHFNKKNIFYSFFSLSKPFFVFFTLVLAIPIIAAYNTDNIYKMYDYKIRNVSNISNSYVLNEGYNYSDYFQNTLNVENEITKKEYIINQKRMIDEKEDSKNEYNPKNKRKFKFFHVKNNDKEIIIATDSNNNIVHYISKHHTKEKKSFGDLYSFDKKILFLTDNHNDSIEYVNYESNKKNDYFRNIIVFKETKKDIDNSFASNFIINNHISDYVLKSVSIKNESTTILYKTYNKNSLHDSDLFKNHSTYDENLNNKILKHEKEKKHIEYLLIIWTTLLFLSFYNKYFRRKLTTLIKENNNFFNKQYAESLNPKTLLLTHNTKFDKVNIVKKNKNIKILKI
jgi:hypothetical protein